MNAHQRGFLRAGVTALLLCTWVGLSRADTVSFNFNSLGDDSSNTSVQSYIQGILTAAGLGTVTVSGAIGEQNYNGDNHVVGNTYSGTVYSNTLGTSDGATGPLSNQRSPVSGSIPKDTFLVNNTDIHTGTDSDRITMTFTLPTNFKIDSISFDYEIFPNANCSGSSCSGSNVPNFTFEVDDSVKLSQNASQPSGSSTNNSPLSSTESAWQFIGVSGVIAVNDSNNQTKLEFIDWPEMIGIDNLVINYHRPPGSSPQVAEPASMLLLGLGLFGLRRRALKSMA